MTKTTGIWVIFFVISLFGWISYTYSCCCPNHCPCCSCCRRNVYEKPYTRCELITPAIFSTLFALTILGGSIAGLVFANDVGNGMKALRCSLMAALNATMYETKDFPGVFGMTNRLAGLS